MTVVHDSLRWFVRSGVGDGFIWIWACGLGLGAWAGTKNPGPEAPRPKPSFTFASKRFTQLVPRPVDVRLHGSKG
jgi:hypothetical protein